MVICPIMKELGYPDDKCLCDYPQLRSQFPEELQCSRGGKCFLKNLIPKPYQGEIQKAEFDHKKIPPEIISAVKEPILKELQKNT